MLGKKIRPYIKKHVEGNQVYETIGKTGMTPNFFSFLALVWAAIGAYFIYTENVLYAFPFIFLAMIWDAIDGAYARTVKKTSYFGAYIEGMIDLYVEIIILLSLIGGNYPFEGSLVLAFGMMLSYAKPRVAQIIPAKDVDWPGIGEKFERRSILIVALILNYFFPSFTAWGINFDTLSIALYLLAVILFIGGAQRMLYAKKLIKEFEKENSSRSS